MRKNRTRKKSWGGGTLPDIFFQDKHSNLEFLAEVRAVSDRDRHEKNPVAEFDEAILSYLQQQRHSSAGIYIDIRHTEEGGKFQLTLPPKNDIEAFVATELGEFLCRIAQYPDKSDIFEYNKDGICFSINYNSNENRFSGSHHINYTIPSSSPNSRNPLRNALQKKGEQLFESGYTGAKGIIICDGGCDSLNERSEINIVENYLAHHEHVFWVFILRIQETSNWLSREKTINIDHKFYWNPKQSKQDFQETLVTLEQMVQHLPKPEATPINAINHLNSPDKKTGRSFYGGFSMSENATIKISTRALTELLAGRIELQRFLEDHGLTQSTFFVNQIAKGNMLQRASVEKEPHSDDDWIVLEYDGPDPAISPFRIPD
ncbi:hypothetical protein KFZ76_15310 [Methylovulum psychrotolerans]|uniref:hypothetical protein n=1 Tax=Methylovulum psychrotolerans TaxID=1704499 RepID=UPI001BFF863F|nr:hypothetical protein [Methylovulum psychrotolerans]MBT9099068.1 hypothetical protein [Methylovulum psychrotolerans]